MAKKALSLDEVGQFVEANIKQFHEAKIRKLRELKLSEVLQRKNPYLFKAKNLLAADEIVRAILDAFLSSHEETIFGTFLEQLAIFVCQRVYGGTKSSAGGIDLEFERSGIRYLVTIKSGPNWGNSSQIERMKTNFAMAKRILATNARKTNVVAVNGCCYGRQSVEDQGAYLKVCGQSFWAFISGDAQLYTKIIEPLGRRAKERNEEFLAAYAQVVNLFTGTFCKHFCKDGVVDWNELVKYNSGKGTPKRLG